MTDQSILEVRLKSAELRPDKMSSRHIAKLIGSVEQMLAAIVARDNPGLALDESRVTIGLSAVYPGSYRVQFQSQYDTQVKTAYEIAATAINGLSFENLPPKSVEALKNIRNISREYRTETQFGYQNGQFVELASVSANTLIHVQVPTMDGETTLYGQLTSIGGVDPPQAQITLVDGQRLKCNVTRKDSLAVAKQLGKRLYTEIGVRGLAHWDIRDMSIIYFRIDELLDYQAIPITESIANSYDVFGHHLEAIDDVDDYFAELREKDDNFL